MNKSTLGLAALLLMGTAPIAMAQEGPGDRMPGPSQGMERHPSSGGPRGDDVGASALRGERGAGIESERGGDGASKRARRAEGPNPAVRTDPPEDRPSGAKREDGSADRAGDRKERYGDSERDPKRTQRSETSPSDKDTKTQKETKAKSDRDEGGTDKAAKEAKDSDRADRKRAKADGRGDADRSAKSNAADRDSARESEREQAGRSSDRADGERAEPEKARKADLSGEKSQRVGAALRGDRQIKRRTNVDIDISVGTRLPRDWDYAPVPASVVALVPEYRGYDVVYVEDEYYITDPVTYEVVAVLPAEGGPRYAAGGGGSGGAALCSETLTLTNDERADILRSIQMTDEVDVSDISVGWSVPGDIELRTFPERLVEHNGKLAACRYFVADDQIAIVDPEEEIVVLLIEQD